MAVVYDRKLIAAQGMTWLQILEKAAKADNILNTYRGGRAAMRLRVNASADSETEDIILSAALFSRPPMLMWAASTGGVKLSTGKDSRMRLMKSHKTHINSKDIGNILTTTLVDKLRYLC